MDPTNARKSPRLGPQQLAQLLRLSVAIVKGDWPLLRQIRSQAHPTRAWREAVLQTHLFAGFPRLVQAYAELAEAGGLGQPEPEESQPPADLEADAKAGMELFQVIYGSGTARVHALLESSHPDWAKLVLGHAYGRILSRSGIAADQRELLAVACLAALDQDRQLASHARGALRCGATPKDVQQALEAIEDLLPDAANKRIAGILARFAQKP